MKQDLEMMNQIMEMRKLRIYQMNGHLKRMIQRMMVTKNQQEGKKKKPLLEMRITR